MCTFCGQDHDLPTPSIEYLCGRYSWISDLLLLAIIVGTFIWASSACKHVHSVRAYNSRTDQITVGVVKEIQ